MSRLKVDYEELPPDPADMIRLLRAIGYSIEQAVADTVDNSIEAGARRILVRLVRDSEAIRQIVIADDGECSLAG